MTACTIRVASKDDLPALEQLQREAGGTGHAIGVGLLLWQGGHGHLFHVVVAEQDNAIVGFAITRPHNDGATEDPALAGLGRLTEIIEIFVTASHRRQGIGTTLVQQVISAARAERCARVTANVTINDAAAWAFFPKLGFGDGNPAFTFALPL
jgi:ribosomal protein S18 acetylase RimI-like enzyme